MLNVSLAWRFCGCGVPASTAFMVARRTTICTAVSARLTSTTTNNLIAARAALSRNFQPWATVLSPLVEMQRIFARGTRSSTNCTAKRATTRSTTLPFCLESMLDP